MNLLSQFSSTLLDQFPNLHYGFGTRHESLTETHFPILKKLPLIRAEQVHGHLVTEIHQTTLSPSQIMPLADGLLTSKKELVLAIKTADCLPLILFEPELNLLSIVHAGWRGALEKIATQAIDKMLAHGGQMKKIVAVFGPTISQEVYEVDQTLFDRFNSPECFIPRTEPGKEGKYLFDLKKKVLHELLSQGISEEHCENISACTYTDKAHFYSFRREPGITERQWTVAYLS